MRPRTLLPAGGAAAALTAVAAATAAAATPPGTIVPQGSIAGVHLRMSAAGVEDVLGKPRTDEEVKDDIQGTVHHLDYGATDVYLSATADGTVYAVTTTSRRPRTSQGVGVGSTEAAVRRSVKGVGCEGSAKLRTCTVGQVLPGRRVTTFFISTTGRVKRVSLGFVID